jgi:hypothetical protein
MAVATTRRVAGWAVAFTALTLALTACNADESDSPDAGDSPGIATSANVDPGGAGNPLLSYLECMQDDGAAITLPTGGPVGMPSGAPGAMPSGFPQP